MQTNSNSTIEEILLLISRTSFPCPKNLDLNNAESLQELCLSLLETLNDRMLQLKHQRKANKHILDRLNQLENKIMSKNRDIGEIILRPSQHLMKDYVASNVDEEVVDTSTSATTPSVSVDDDSDELLKVFSPDPETKMSLNVNPPPDIIASEIHRPVVSAGTDPEPELERDSDLLNEPIVLPDHLQKLVDDAMKEILCQSLDQ